ncbi:MAG: ATP-dependent zinc metalloprotease FtsH [Acidimicrobiales bacterium]
MRPGSKDKGGDGKHPEGPSLDGGGEDRDRSRRRGLLLCVIAMPILVILFVLVLVYSQPRTSGTQLRLDQFTALIRQGQIQSANILDTENRIVGRYSGGQYWVAYGTQPTIFAQLSGTLQAAGVPTVVQQQPFRNLVTPAELILPSLIIIDGLFIIFLFIGTRNDGGMGGFGRSRAKRQIGGEAKITFSDVAGVDEAIEELAEIRDYLSSPDRFLAMGATVPKGILLTGPPGCGKTLLARALAGESHVPFFSISGSDFVEIFVGVGAARIRDLFKVTKANAPAIVFIDELDAVGRTRSVGAVSGQDERESTLNQLLVEMDGFDSGSGVLVLAATNRPDILDSALLRPGRFDRRVSVDRPDVRGRLDILRVHARGKPLGDEVDLGEVARRTVGFSGADLANVINEAALLASRRGSVVIASSHLLEAIERAVAGAERTSRIMSPEERDRVAYHEGGHAVVAAALPNCDRVSKVSIVARSHAGGFTWYLPEGDQFLARRSQIIDRLTVLVAGRAAEQVILGESSTAGEHDLQQAATMARRMVTEWGMGQSIGPMSLKQSGDSMELIGPSPRLMSDVDEEVVAILKRAEEVAMSVVEENRHVLEALVVKLVEVENLEGNVLDGFLAGVLSRASSTAELTKPA